jgi:hypothetical protein
MIEFKNITIDKYIENAPKTIGFLLYLYGPVATSFLVRGLIAIPNPSAGPPLPILNKKIVNPKIHPIIYLTVTLISTFCHLKI